MTLGTWRSWLSGHAWTIGGDLRHRFRPTTPPPDEPWELELTDDRVGLVTLSGRLHAPPDATGVVLAVHGLGGSADSGYIIRLARAAAEAGLACLRINLRGADGLGDDLYHAGLSVDLAKVLGSRALRGYADQFAIGYSLGGHTVLRLGAEAPSKLRRVAAVSAPLDLALSCQAIDQPRAWLYRSVVLRSLKASYAEVLARHGEQSPRVPSPWSVVRGVTTIHDWDAAVVVPRHGFESVAHYHRTMSVGPRLTELPIPALYVGARADPMVPHWTMKAALEHPLDNLDVHLTHRGGHVALPSPLGPTPLEPTLINWLTQ